MIKLDDLLHPKEIFDERDDFFMQQAQYQAELAYQQHEVPVGAVIVVDGQIVSSAHNQVEQLNNPCAHAEILAITRACSILSSTRLTEATLYVTLEPCAMCSGAILNAKVGTVVYAAAEPKLGSLGSKFNLFADHPMNHFPKIKSGLNAKQSTDLLQKFFNQLRK